MKFTTLNVVLGLAVASTPSAVSGFASSKLNNRRAFVAASQLNAEQQQQQSRREILTGVATSVLLGGASSLLSAPQTAAAYKYAGVGRGSAEVLDPAEAEVDTDILNSAAVQSALDKVKGYQNAVRYMKDGLTKDPQANVRPVILKELEFSSLRANFNTVNTAFEEDTQRGTDRLIRAVMQDITELEKANEQKDGVPRSERRLETMMGKLTKLDQAFDDFLAFTKK